MDSQGTKHIWILLVRVETIKHSPNTFEHSEG